jgi:hypothetical protein
MSDFPQLLEYPMRPKEHTIFPNTEKQIANNGATRDSALIARPQIVCEKSGLASTRSASKETASRFRR